MLAVSVDWGAWLKTILEIHETFLVSNTYSTTDNPSVVMEVKSLKFLPTYNTG